MELKTILNRVYQLPGFVYGRIRLVRAEEEGERDRLEVEGLESAGDEEGTSPSAGKRAGRDGGRE